jgi:predicted AAA+ superfamily ATPase
LSSVVNEKQFKVLFLDVGLMVRATRLNAELLLSNNLLLANRGKIAEQFVGQELLAYADPIDEAAVYFWCREKSSSTAEVDYVISVDSHILPVEVKAGTTGQLKSLKILMQERDLPLGIRVSQLPLQIESKVLSLPFYLLSQLHRLVMDTIET